MNRINRSGTRRVALFSPAIADTATAPVQCMGIKRMANVLGDGRYLLEMIVSIESKTSQYNDRPLAFGWGLDLANAAGVRTFFKIKYQNYSTETASRVNRWQIKTGLGSSNANFTTLPGGDTGAYDALENTNENKALPFYIALEVDTTARRYLGARIGNWVAAGSLAATPNSDLEALGPMPLEDLISFRGGLNSAFDIDVPVAGSRIQGQSNLHYHRLTYLGA
jgi:hypothetical protein